MCIKVEIKPIKGDAKVRLYPTTRSKKSITYPNFHKDFILGWLGLKDEEKGIKSKRTKKQLSDAVSKKLRDNYKSLQDKYPDDDDLHNRFRKAVERSVDDRLEKLNSNEELAKRAIKKGFVRFSDDIDFE